MENKIITQDAKKGMEKLNDNSVKLLMTSPPYWNMRNYSGYKEQFGFFENEDDYINNLLNIFSEIPRILQDDGAFVLNIDDVFFKEWRLIPFKIADKLKDKLILQEIVIWRKTNPQPYLSEARLTHGYEYCFIFIKNNLKFKFNKEKKKFISDVFDCRIGNKGLTNHIATFPYELPKYFIELLSEKNDLVLDIFAGSGTTLIQAKALGRRYLGFDTKEEYVQTALKRLNETTPPLFTQSPKEIGFATQNSLNRNLKDLSEDKSQISANAETSLNSDIK